VRRLNLFVTVLLLLVWSFFTLFVVYNFNADDSECSEFRYLKCLVLTDIKHELFSDEYKYFTDILQGHLHQLNFLCKCVYS